MTVKWATNRAPGAAPGGGGGYQAQAYSGYAAPAYGGYGGYGGYGPANGGYGGGYGGAPQPPAPGGQSSKVFVGNLPGDIQDDAIKMVFGSYGTVMDTHIIK